MKVSIRPTRGLRTMRRLQCLVCRTPQHSAAQRRTAPHCPRGLPWSGRVGWAPVGSRSLDPGGMQRMESARGCLAVPFYRAPLLCQVTGWVGRSEVEWERRHRAHCERAGPRGTRGWGGLGPGQVWVRGLRAGQHSGLSNAATCRACRAGYTGLHPRTGHTESRQPKLLNEHNGKALFLSNM